MLLSPEFKLNIINNIQNVLGWRTDRKIVVFESDDWGSIRMPSKAVYELLIKSGIRVDNDPYNKYDSFSSEEDLNSLFDVLSAFKDKNGNSPVITANCVVANPDFNKIKESNFQEYHFELFTETLKKYPKHLNSFKLWQEGISNKLIYPQFHGREHLNVNRWMKALQENSVNTHLAFAHELFGINFREAEDSRGSYMASLDFNTGEEMNKHKKIVGEGLDLFEQIYGFRSVSFTAPCYTWSRSMEPILYDAGIRYLKSNFIQAEPAHLSNKINYKKHYHYLGQKNKFQQFYFIRNCFFEPSQKENFDWINYCIKGIENAFTWHKPASISTHRLNFIGFVDPANRDRNLPKFKTLISEILKRWPETEFMTSTQLGELIESTKT
ncbi:MAG: hypothetical protein P4L35_03990 [Ignavibacteriaceae bacterium]|nr:hypothetical protein [Ignavibacteriaceae bacterium]